MSIINDPVVEDIRRRRKELLQKEFSGSVKKMGEVIRKYQREHPDKIVNMRELKKLKRAS